MHVQDAACECVDEARRENSHEAREDDEAGLIAAAAVARARRRTTPGPDSRAARASASEREGRSGGQPGGLRLIAYDHAYVDRQFAAGRALGDRAHVAAAP